MKNKKKYLFIIILLLTMFLFNLSVVHAINFEMEIKGRHFIGTDRSIQLHAKSIVYNDVAIPGMPNGGTGKVDEEDVTTKAVWTSSNPSVATVNSNGVVTGISTGIVTITAEYSDTDTHTIIVISSFFKIIIVAFLLVITGLTIIIKKNKIKNEENKIGGTKDEK